MLHPRRSPAPSPRAASLPATIVAFCALSVSALRAESLEQAPLPVDSQLEAVATAETTSVPEPRFIALLFWSVGLVLLSRRIGR